jgi:hypothetical protein
MVQYDELKHWSDTLIEYNERYESLDNKIKEKVKFAKRLLHLKKPSPDVADALVEVSLVVQQLVDFCADAGYNARGTKNFYERSLIKRKLEIMAEGEKKIAANVAEGQAVIDCSDIFLESNLAEMLRETTEKRYEATKELVASLRTKLEYGYKP